MFKPLSDRVLVEPTPVPTKTNGGIVLPELRVGRPETTGTVTAVGEGRYTKKGVKLPHVCGVGDTVVFSPRAGQELRVGDRRFIMLREDELLAVYENGHAPTANSGSVNLHDSEVR